MSFKHLFAAKAIAISSLAVSGAVHGIGWHHGISIGLASEQSELTLTSNAKTLAELDNLSSKFADNYSIQGYSISPNWAISYQLDKNETELTDISSKYQQQNLQFDIGMSVFSLDRGLNLYPLIGIRHTSVDILSHDFSSTQGYAGFRLDVPVFKRLYLHAKADTNLTKDKATNISAAINYRYMRNHSIMLEWQAKSLEMTEQENNTDYLLERDSSQLALRWYLVW
ncbi:hypothetical protein DS2_07408 [Catenovulum agarivorans DS-2]|uniref:Outer membrane protein beta-barrel domain-containing protein n=1 Tax=Catenovulum agarivorans DS-2 TaxID=1328313 RepID=W7QFF6_9ALTE|nr:porin family protein [Catenovulum agarivorans]EWH10641.1 hypothetical protein DS2_07408 [Catenovulum agarivorans DS-2]